MNYLKNYKMSKETEHLLSSQTNTNRLEQSIFSGNFECKLI